MIVPEKIGRIRLIEIRNPTNPNNYINPGDWADHSAEMNYTKYNIKETDMRVKTASFTSPDYIDLTTSQYVVLISSKYHENFSGYVLDVEYDPETSLYTYQCQDWSRKYINHAEMIWDGSRNIYTHLISLLTNLEIDKIFSSEKKKLPNSYPKSAKDRFKPVLSGLKGIGHYDQSLYEGNKYKGNPFKNKPKFIARGKTKIEIIRNLVFSQLGFFDIWFNDRGILQIEPISKKDWEKTGLHLTTNAAMKQKYKFSTTNAITRAYVEGTGTNVGKGYNLNNLKSGKLDLTLFFGKITSDIKDPVQQQTTTTTHKSTTSTSKSKTTTTNKDNPYGTKRKEVWITIDNIFGKSADKKIMNDFAREVQKAGWTTHVGNVGPSYHYAHAPGYSWAGKVWNAVWFVIYGGACAGTLNEAATARWYRKPLVDRGSRTVVGFIHPPCGDIRKGGKYYSYLQRAHDDNFSPPSFRGISNPGKFLTNKAIPWMYAKDGKSLAQSFLQGGDNPEACNKNWKFY